MSSTKDTRPRKRRKWCVPAVPLVLSLCASLNGCLVSGDRCDRDQKLGEGDVNVCVCVEGTVRDPRGYGCKECGDNEVAVGAECQCKLGFERKTPSGPCMESTGGVLGAACDDQTPCSAPYPYCASSDADERFCTSQGCKTQDACPTTWRCLTSGAESFCTKPPRGHELACKSGADCADTEATFCDSFFTNKCYVEKCATGEQVCPSGYSCCDLTALVGTSVCTPAALLEGGTCPDMQPPVPQ